MQCPYIFFSSVTRSVSARNHSDTRVISIGRDVVKDRDSRLQLSGKRYRLDAAESDLRMQTLRVSFFRRHSRTFLCRTEQIALPDATASFFVGPRAKKEDLDRRNIRVFQQKKCCRKYEAAKAAISRETRLAENKARCFVTRRRMCVSRLLLFN